MSEATSLPNLHELWNYQKPDETEQRFRDLLPRAEAAGDLDYELQLRTQIARTLGLQRKFAEAHRELDAVEGQLTDDTRTARVRYLLERGRTLNSSQRPDEARPLFLQAWELGQEYGTDDYAVDAAHMMAIVEPPGKKLAWNLKGAAVAEQSTNERARGWLGALTNNIGWDYHEQGQYEEALLWHRKCLDCHEASNRRKECDSSQGERIARWSVAKQLRCLGKLDEALAMQRELHDHYEQQGEPDGFVFEELGECLHAQGKTEASQPWFAKAHEQLAGIDWVAEDTARMERLRRLAGL